SDTDQTQNLQAFGREHDLRVVEYRGERGEVGFLCKHLAQGRGTICRGASGEGHGCWRYSAQFGKAQGGGDRAQCQDRLAQGVRRSILVAVESDQQGAANVGEAELGDSLYDLALA